MPDTFITQYLTDAVRQFHTLRALAEQAVAQCSDETLFIVLDEEANSIATLVKHMAGSLQTRWAAFPASAEAIPGRDRDEEFLIQEGETTQVLLEQWEVGWNTLFEALDRLTVEDMAKIIEIRGKSLSVLEAINRQLTHYAYHVGQIVFLAKHFRSGAWQSLSIPRGQSQHYTAATLQPRQAGRDMPSPG